MTDINLTFSRVLLSSVMDDIRKVTTPKERKDAWVYHLGGGHWEFHGPNHYYWHGEADNAYEARAKGWSQWWEQLQRDTMQTRPARGAA